MTEDYKIESWLKNKLKTRNIVEIAKECGVTRNTISYYINMFKLTAPPKGRPKILNEKIRKLNKKESVKKSLKKLSLLGFKQFKIRLTKKEYLKFSEIKKKFKAKSYNELLRVILKDIKILISEKKYVSFTSENKTDKDYKLFYFDEINIKDISNLSNLSGLNIGDLFSLIIAQF